MPTFSLTNKVQPVSDQTMSKTIDLLRFPLAILVIFIHTYGPNMGTINELLGGGYQNSQNLLYALRIAISNCFSVFAVPAFFLFSGYLFFYKVDNFNLTIYQSKVTKRIKTLLIPYIAWTLIFLLFKLVLTLKDDLSLEAFIQFIKNTHGFHIFWDYHVLYPYLVPMWYVRDLIIVVGLAPLFYVLYNKFQNKTFLPIALLYLSCLWPESAGFRGTPFFWFFLGSIISIHKINLVEATRRYETIGYIVFVATLLLTLIAHDGFSSLWTRILQRIYVISAVISAINLSSHIVENCSRLTNFGLRLSKYSFFIFAGHCFLTDTINYDGITSVPLQTLIYLTLPLLIALFLIIVYEIAKKICPRLLALLTGDRLK